MKYEWEFEVDDWDNLEDDELEDASDLEEKLEILLTRAEWKSV